MPKMSIQDQQAALKNQSGGQNGRPRPKRPFGRAQFKVRLRAEAGRSGMTCELLDATAPLMPTFVTKNCPVY